MADEIEKLTEEEGKEFISYLTTARKDHVATTGAFANGLLQQSIDMDVNIQSRGVKLPEGGYAVHVPSENEPDNDMTVWTIDIDIDEETAAKMLNSSKSDHKDTEQIKLHFNFVRVEDANGEPITFQEVLVWLAIQDAEQSGDADKARRILELAYGKKQRKPNARKDIYQRRKDENVRIPNLKVPIDPISRAVFQRQRGHVTAENYWSDKPKVVRTGKGRSVLLTLRTGVAGGITANEEDYVLSDKVSYWLDAVVSLAKDGNDVILGSDILRQNGYENPYSESMSTTMGEAVTCLAMAKATLIAVDASDEQGKTKRGKNPTSSMKLQSVLDGEIYLDEYEVDEEAMEEGATGKKVRDFRITLKKRDEYGSLLASLPLAKQAEDRDELVTINPEEERFRTVKRLTETERRMWRYVLKTIKSRTAKPTILFDTMFKTLELDPPKVATTQRKQVRNPVTNKLETVMDENGEPLQVPRTERQMKAARKQAEARQRKRLITRLDKMLYEKTHPRMVKVLGDDGKPRTNPRTGETMTRAEYETLVTTYKITDEKLTFTRRKKN